MGVFAAQRTQKTVKQSQTRSKQAGRGKPGRGDFRRRHPNRRLKRLPGARFCS